MDIIWNKIAWDVIPCLHTTNSASTGGARTDGGARGHLVGVVSFNECGQRIFESKNYLTAKAL